ncbi:class I SAM-dependent methyltransferase [bacterium]|jgi:ubiquinone/menaquinone biosynthesis C-methylase UbiE|nr:class I SAM-dependent methyltransferase [bacterium]
MQNEFLNPQEILNTLTIKPTMIACDFGCGAGGWTIPLAEMVPSGMVYAVDILEEPLSFLIANAKRQNVNNIKPILSDIEKGVKIINNDEVDLVFIINTLFQSDDIELILNEADRILKKKGLMFIADWKDGNPMGLKNELIKFEIIKKNIIEKGYSIEKEFDAGQYHRALIFKK